MDASRIDTLLSHPKLRLGNAQRRLCRARLAEEGDGARLPRLLVQLVDAPGEAPLPPILVEADWRRPVPGMPPVAAVEPTAEELEAVLACPAVRLVQADGSLEFWGAGPEDAP